MARGDNHKGAYDCGFEEQEQQQAFQMDSVSTGFTCFKAYFKGTYREQPSRQHMILDDLFLLTKHCETLFLYPVYKTLWRQQEGCVKIEIKTT